jgi:hypothetical protein
MPIVNGAFSRDANYVPITRDGVTVTKDVTFTGSNTTVNVPLFSLTGSVVVYQLYGIVTTTLGSNHTAAYWQINDGTANPDITLATGTTLSNYTVGSLIFRRSITSVALFGQNATASSVHDPVAATVPDFMMPFAITQKTGGVATNLEYVYTTTNTPTTGAMTFYAKYVPLSADGSLTAV